MTINSENIDDISYLFFILQHQRFRIIELLQNDHISFKDIQDRLKEKYEDDTYNFALERNLDFLIEHKVIEKILNKDKDKKSYNLYKLTNLGLQLYGLSFTYQYLWKNKLYFLNHNFLNLPSQFYLNLGIFVNENLQQIEGRPKIYSRLVEMYKSARFVYNILFELEGSKEVMEILLDKLKSTSFFQTKTIIGSNKILDPHRPSKIFEFDEYKDAGRVLHKDIPKKINISLVVTDRSAFISFPREKDGDPDTNTILYGESQNFLAWCLNYFQYLWEKEEGKSAIEQPPN